jgi:hypothetical protein
MIYFKTLKLNYLILHSLICKYIVKIKIIYYHHSLIIIKLFELVSLYETLIWLSIFKNLEGFN